MSATALPETLARIALCLPTAQVVVADGGSTDGTREWLRAQPSVRLAETVRGRGPQMNAGAAVADGEILLFVHADCLLPQDAGDAICAALSDPAVAGGAFPLCFPPGSPPDLHRLAYLINLRSRMVSEASGRSGDLCPAHGL